MNTKSVLIVTMTLLFTCCAWGQKPDKKITVTGHVTDSLLIPVQGAIIFIDSEKTNCMTNARGYYKINIKPGARKIMVLSPLNEVCEKSLDGSAIIDFTLTRSQKSPSEGRSKDGKGEAVDVGYGSMDKKKVTSGKASSNTPKFSSYSNIYDMIRNEVPGVQVIDKSVILQGISSFGGSSDALLVVDGIAVNQIDDVLPSDVKSIQVLKGPATAIYGIQGANGVLLIKTKRGSDK